MKLSPSDQPHKCEYCGKKFTREKTLQTHICEKKRRHLQKSEKSVQYGLHTFVKFYQLSVGSKQTKTYEEFCDSPFYNAFVKFGSFLSNVRPLYPEKYIEHIVTSGIKVDKWCDEKLYEKYVIDLIFKENVETALERSINTMVAWGEDNKAQWNHYFLYASTNRVTWDIKDGKISPWLLLNSTSGREMLAKFNDEQLNMLVTVLDPTVWNRKFKTQRADLELVKHIIQESKL